MESTSPPGIWDKVLITVVIGVVLYGVSMVIAGLLLGDHLFDLLGFGPDDGGVTSDQSRDYLRLVFGVLGAVIVGWMITIGMITVGPLRRREPWAWWTIVSATVTWFILDTGLSLVLGYIGHALFNVGFAIALAVPLGAIQRELA